MSAAASSADLGTANLPKVPQQTGVGRPVSQVQILRAEVTAAGPSPSPSRYILSHDSSAPPEASASGEPRSSTTAVPSLLSSLTPAMMATPSDQGPRPQRPQRSPMSSKPT